MMPGFTPPPQRSVGFSGASSSAPIAPYRLPPSPMTGIAVGSPVNASGGANPYTNGFQGIDPRQNPYYKPVQQTLPGQTVVDPLKQVMDEQAQNRLDQAGWMQKARAADNSPMAMLKRGLLGFTHQPIPTSQQQRTAQFLMQRQAQNDADINQQLKAFQLRQLSPQEYNKANQDYAMIYGKDAGDYNNAGNTFLSHQNTYLNNEDDNATKAYTAMSNDRNTGFANQTTRNHDLNQHRVSQQAEDYREKSGNRDFGLKVGDQVYNRANDARNFGLKRSEVSYAKDGTPSGPVYDETGAFARSGYDKNYAKPEEPPVAEAPSQWDQWFPPKPDTTGKPSVAEIQNELARRRALAARIKPQPYYSAGQ
jgi:hypothetical protein